MLVFGTVSGYIIVETFLGRRLQRISSPEGDNFDNAWNNGVRIFLDTFLTKPTDIQSSAHCTHLRRPIRVPGSHGILTVCPSGAPFGIPLGPTNPTLIIIESETLLFRRGEFSSPLRLLVPTVSLLHTPRWVSPSASARCRTLSYHLRTS